jgi:hypothetical protein
MEIFSNHCTHVSQRTILTVHVDLIDQKKCVIDVDNVQVAGADTAVI